MYFQHFKVTFIVLYESVCLYLDRCVTHSEWNSLIITLQSFKVVRVPYIKKTMVVLRFRKHVHLEKIRDDCNSSSTPPSSSTKQDKFYLKHYFDRPIISKKIKLCEKFQMGRLVYSSPFLFFLILFNKRT